MTKCGLFKVIVALSILLIGVYFVISLTYTAKGLPNNGTGVAVTTNTVSIEATAHPVGKVLSYSAVATEYGASVFVPHKGWPKVVSYDKSVVSVRAVPVGDGVVVEVKPKKFFTSTTVRITFKDGTEAIIQLTGSFSPSIGVNVSTDELHGVAGEELNLTVRVANTGLIPFDGTLKVSGTPNVEASPSFSVLTIPPGSSENVTITVSLKSPGYGGLAINVGGREVFIPVEVIPPFTVENYTGSVSPGGDIKIEVVKNTACKVEVSYGGEELYADGRPSKGVEVISVPVPVRGVPLIPLTVEGCGYKRNLFVSVKTVENATHPSIAVVPVGKLVYAPGSYEVILRNDGSSPVNVSISVEHGDGISVAYPHRLTVPPFSSRAVDFNITVDEVFSGAGSMTVRVEYPGGRWAGNVTVVPNVRPELNVRITPLVSPDGIVSARMEIEPSEPVENTTLHYTVKMLYDGVFVAVLDTKVNFKVLERTMVILPQMRPSSVMIVSLSISSGGRVIYSTSKTFVFKRLKP